MVIPDTSITPKRIRVIGVPLDLGQARRGVDMGPSAVRGAGLEARLGELGHSVEDAGHERDDSADEHERNGRCEEATSPDADRSHFD